MKWTAGLIAALLAALMSACADTTRDRNVDYSGFLGDYSMLEVKVKDATSGVLLGAGVAHRVGGKLLQASHFSSWGEVEDMMQLWASQGSFNLCELQKRTDCVNPKS